MAPSPSAAGTRADPLSLVRVFGSDNSPWTQAVLLALHHHHVSYELVSHPLSWAAYWVHGMVVPVCQFADGSILRDSFAITRKVFELRSGGKARQQYLTEQCRLEAMFLTYVLARTKNPLRFIDVWSRTCGTNLTAMSTLGRAYTCLYFFVLIHVGILHKMITRQPVLKPKVFVHELEHWDVQFEACKGAFLGGPVPNELDIAVLGQIQCMATGPTDHILPLIESRPHLMEWLGRMHKLLEGYDRMYSRRLLDRDITTAAASFLDRACFYLALFCLLWATPYTSILLLDSTMRRFRNPVRSNSYTADSGPRKGGSKDYPAFLLWLSLLAFYLFC